MLNNLLIKTFCRTVGLGVVAAGIDLCDLKNFTKLCNQFAHKTLGPVRYKFSGKTVSADDL